VPSPSNFKSLRRDLLCGPLEMEPLAVGLPGFFIKKGVMVINQT